MILLYFQLLPHHFGLGLLLPFYLGDDAFRSGVDAIADFLIR